jgi:hypothetical protein
MSQNKTKKLNQLSPTAAINKSYVYIQYIFIPIFNIKRQYIKMRQMQSIYNIFPSILSIRHRMERRDNECLLVFPYCYLIPSMTA